MPTAVGLMIVLTALIWWRHRENIRRILAGTESKIGK
jgi:glycerol-3-phosphate acyltransferase PlsY